MVLLLRLVGPRRPPCCDSVMYGGLHEIRSSTNQQSLRRERVRLIEWPIASTALSRLCAVNLIYIKKNRKLSCQGKCKSPRSYLKPSSTLCPIRANRSVEKKGSDTEPGSLRLQLPFGMMLVCHTRRTPLASDTSRTDGDRLWYELPYQIRLTPASPLATESESHALPTPSSAYKGQNYHSIQGLYWIQMFARLTLN